LTKPHSIPSYHIFIIAIKISGHYGNLMPFYVFLCHTD